MAVEQYLRVFAAHRQDDWVDFLSLAEFTYNNSNHSSISMSPFYANYGYNPMFTDLPTIHQSSPVAGEIADRLAKVQEELKAAMKIAQERHARFYDEHHGDIPKFEVGNKVWLEASNIQTDRPSKKLSAKWLGPFPITAVISTHAYRLALPATPKIYSNAPNGCLHTKTSEKDWLTLPVRVTVITVMVSSNPSICI